MSRRRLRLLILSATALLAVGAAFVIAFASSGSSSSAKPSANLKLAGGGLEATLETRFGGGNERLGWMDYRLAARAYPSTGGIPLSWRQNARETFNRIASRTPRNPNPGIVNSWQPYGPTNPVEPGVLAFGGAPSVPASRTPAMVISPTCNETFCRLWAGPAGGGVWRTDNPLAATPTWQYLSAPFELNAIGDIVLDPNDFTGQTLYVGTGEANTCSSGCELGVGIYRSTNGGNSWTKLPSACVSNGTYACVNGGDAFNGRAISEVVIDPTNPAHILVTSSRAAVRGLSHNIGGGGQNTVTPGANPIGLYESTNGGATFTMVWDGAGNGLGLNDIGLDPLDPRVVYVSALGVGIYRRCPTGGSAACGGEAGTDQFDFDQVFSNGDPTELFSRTMFDLTVKNAKTRIYVGDGNEGGNDFDSFWRIDNANQTSATLLGNQASGNAAPAGVGNPFPAVYNNWQRLTAGTLASPYVATFEYCTGQCSYDNDVMTPHNPELPDTVYVIGSYGYGELPCYTKGVGCGAGWSNGRAILYSTTAGDPDPNNLNRTFTDMSYDGQNVPGNHCALFFSSCLVAHNAVHPDQHEIVVNPSKPTQFFESSDGGIIRSNGSFLNLSRACEFRDLANPSNALTTCRRLLSRVPNTLGTINKGLLSLQFFGFAFNPTNPCDVIAGTQDNSTWRSDTCDGETWRKTIYGDGGSPGFDTTRPDWQFNEFVFGFSDSNFRNGDPEKWVISSAPLVNSGEAVAFYWPQIADPNPPLFGADRTHPIFSGLQHVWRSWAFGAGRPQNSVPQQVVPDVAFYEANCPEFTTPGSDPNCGDYQPLGGPSGTNQPGDLTGNFYGGDRIGGVISWMARNKADFNTLWAGTTTGRLFVSHNANATNPAAVTFHRVDNASSPNRFISSIYPDINNVNRAWISYSGYNAATPGTPGHVFHVNENGVAPGSGVFTNLNVEGGTTAFPTPTNNGDLPIADVIRDDQTGNLYAASDFGVLKGTPTGPNTYSWSVTPGMPRFEVVQLTPVMSSRDACTANCVHAVYAVTHSQGIWVMNLG